MLGLLLTLAVLPQGTNQARLHPADAMVMIEVPDFTKVLAAYERAPMIQMLRDAEVRKAFHGAFEGTGFDVQEMLAETLTSMGMPAEFAGDPMAGVRHHLEGLGAASLSVTVDGERLLAHFSPERQPVRDTVSRIDVLEAAIEAYHERAGMPADLAALKLDDALITDAWGRRFNYTIIDEAQYSLVSLGSDGAPGGVGLAADIGRDDVAESEPEPLEVVGVQAVIEFKSPAALDEMRSMLTGLIAKAELQPARNAALPMAGVQGELQSWKFDEAGTGELWLMRVQNTLVAGLGRATPEAYAARLADVRLQSAADKFYADLQTQFGTPTGVTIVQGAMRTSGYADILRAMSAAEGGEDEGTFDMIESMLPDCNLRMQLVGDRFISEFTTLYAKPTGIVLEALGLSPIPASILTAVPEDAIAVYATSIDGPLMWRSFIQGMDAEGDPGEETQEQLAAMEERYSFSVEKDVFGSMGGGMVAYMLAPKGVTGLPGMAAVIELRDAEALKRGVEGLLAVLEEETGGEVKVRAKPYRDMPVWTFDVNGEGGASDPLSNSLSPSISIVKNRLLITLNSNHIKKEIKRALGEEQGVHLIATEGHRPPPQATTFGYMDWASLLNGAYTGGRGLLGLMGGFGSAPIDATKLPEPEVFTRFYKPTILYTRTIANGTYTRNESSFGPETWGSLIGLGAVAAFGFSASESLITDDASGDFHELDAEVEVAPADPAAPAGNAVEDGKAKSTRESLRQASTAIAVFQMDTGKYPAKLEDLLTATKNYPSGFLKQGAIPQDGWGRALRYSSLEGGARYRLWSVGANGTDDQGSGDDIVGL